MRQGNIYLRTRDGREQQLTASERDSDPSLSPDGSTVVFVRLVKDTADASGLGRVVEQSEIAAVGTDGQNRRIKVLLEDPVDARGLRFQWFSSPQFSADGNFVHFLVPDFSTVSPGLFSLELKTGQVHFLAQAIRFWEMNFGPYRGDLIVWQNPMLVGGGRYDIFNLLTPTGAAVGVVGFSEAQANAFISGQPPSH